MAKSERSVYTKRLATCTFQQLARLGGMDSRVTGHVCRVTGAQAMVAAGIELWLIQAFLPLGLAGGVRVCAGLPASISNRHGMEGRVGPELRTATERVFEEALEESVQGVGVIGLQAANQVKEQIEGRLLAAARVGPVRFVSCAEVASGKALVWKSDTVTWCGGVGCTW